MIDETVEIAALVVGVSEKALKIRRYIGAGGSQLADAEWVPRSQVVGGDEYDQGDDDILLVAEWLARDRDWDE